MVAAQLTFADAATPPPTATWDWTPKRDHARRLYRRTHCAQCRGDVWALITPGWLVGECGHKWRDG